MAHKTYKDLDIKELLAVKYLIMDQLETNRYILKKGTDSDLNESEYKHLMKRNLLFLSALDKINTTTLEDLQS